jgi:hypothetical protein
MVSRTASAAEVVANFTGAVIVAVAQQLQSALGAPVAVAATPDTAVAPATPATTAAVAAPSSTWDKLAPVLAAIGTGIGVIGFVTFIGGVVVWARLNGAGLPAAPALSVYPKQDLLVIGGQTLVPQLLVALAFVVVLSAFYLLVRLVVDRVGESEATLLAGQAPGLVALCMFVFVLIELGSTLIWYRSTLGGGEQALGVGLALGGAGVAALVGSVTRRYLYLAVTSFMILGVLMTFIAYWRARDDKQVRGPL